jgi:hypothetical protein
VWDVGDFLEIQKDVGDFLKKVPKPQKLFGKKDGLAASVFVGTGLLDGPQEVLPTAMPWLHLCPPDSVQRRGVGKTEN